jgi:predicted PurR-regulated permease PerM
MSSRPNEDDQEPQAALPDRPDNAAAIAIVRRSGAARVRSRMLTGLFILALFYTVYFTSAQLIPVILAILAYLLLSPIVRWLKRHLRLPMGLVAALVVLALLTSVFAGFYSLSNPAARWLRDLPVAAAELEWKLYSLRQSVGELREAVGKLQDFAQGAAGEQGDDQPTAVTIEGPNLTQMFLGGTLSVGAGLVIATALLFFLLASDDNLLRQAVTILPQLRDKKRLVEIVRDVEDDVSYYLLTITVINIGLGVAIGAAMWLLGMPNPYLWGAMAAVLNFIPLIGALLGVGIVGLVALLTFSTTAAMLLPPIIYLLLTSLEGQLVTPAVVARRLSLNPVVVFLALISWTWLWGIAGALLAVPLLATFKICCDHIEALKPVGVLLARYDEGGSS